MRIRGTFGSTLLGLSLAGLVVVGSSGCGGEAGPETGDAVVVTPPAESPAEPAPEPTPAAPESETQPASTPATGTGAPTADE